MTNASRGGPEQERRRALSCNYCRTKKIKCSRTEPCANCVDHGKTCIYPFIKRRAPRREKQSKALEERLARMEMLLEFANGDSVPVDSGRSQQQTESPSSGDEFPSHCDSRMTQDTSYMRSPVSARILRPLGSANDTELEAPQPCSSHVECADLLGSEVGWEYHGPTSFLSICSVPGISWVTERTGEPGFFETAKSLVLNIDSRLKMQWAPGRGDIPEPDMDAAWKYCRAYFEQSFDAGLGLVSQQVFEARLQLHLSQEDTPDDDPSWYALRNTVYASGYRLSSPNMLYSSTFTEAQGQAWKYFEKALSVHTELLYCTTGLMAVQALTAMSFFAEGLGSPSLGYMLTSCAVRLAQAKGLHRQAAQSWNLPETEQQHRIRLFWTLYILEKHICYRSGRPSTIDDDDISCPLPASDGSTTDISSFGYMVRHAQVSSRIAKQLATGNSFRQTPGKILEVIQRLSAELQEWRGSLPLFLRPDAPTRDGQCLQNINPYHVMYLRYAYFGSVMAIHSILTHPWNSSLFGSGQTLVLRNNISISAHVVVNAARSVILDTNSIHIDASTPIWLALYFPLVSVINIFIYILKYPTLPTADSDVALLDVATGHFSRLELASPDIAFPFVREVTRLARATVESVKEAARPTDFLLGSGTQALEDNSRNEDMIEFYSDNWSIMFSSLISDSGATTSYPSNHENLGSFDLGG